MQSENTLHIHLAKASEAAEPITMELTDRFFADLGQEEISGGNVLATLKVERTAGSIYKVRVHAQGSVIVPCDRCLDPLTLNIETEDILKVKDDVPDESDDPEMLYTEGNTSVADLSWSIYELIETALPLCRTHDEGTCNEEMLSYISNASDEEDEE